MAIVKFTLIEHTAEVQGVEVRCKIEGVNTLLEREISLALAHYLEPLVRQYTDQMALKLSSIANKPVPVQEEQPHVH